MNKNEILDKLRDYRYQVLSLKRINDKIKAIRGITQTPSSSSYEGVKVANRQTLNEKIVNLVDLELEYLNKSADIELTLGKIEALLDKLDTKHSLILKYYYLDGYTIAQIGHILGYEEITIKKYKADALETLYDFIL